MTHSLRRVVTAVACLAAVLGAHLAGATGALGGGTPPVITLLSAACVPVAGGTSVTITGTGFVGADTVSFGAGVGAPVGVNPVVGGGGTTITVTTPPENAGIVDVTVTDPSGASSAPSSSDQLDYAPGGLCAVQSVVPACGSPAGGTNVMISGPGVAADDTVSFGGTAASSVSWVPPTAAVPGSSVATPGFLQATAPPGTGTVPVTVHDANGTSVASSADNFTYKADTSQFDLCATATSFSDISGKDMTLAAGHPASVTANFSFNTDIGADGTESPSHNVKDFSVTLPAGFLASLNAVGAQCPQQDFDGQGGATCPAAAQVGWLAFADSAGARQLAPVYLLARPPGHLAEVGVQPLASAFIPVGIRVLLDLNSSFQLTATIQNLTAAAPILGGALEVLGQTPGEALPFLYFPPSCSQQGSLQSHFAADDWAGDVTSDGPSSNPGSPGATTGCALPFSPSLSVAPGTTQADSATGLGLHIELPEDSSGPQWSTPAKALSVQLPLGLSLNPAVADGITACTSTEFGLGNTAPSNCPPSSAVGVLNATSPVLPGVLTGGVYIAQDGTAATTPANPFHVFVEAVGPGLDVKFEGSLVPDPSTGQLTAALTGLPPVPLGTVDLQFDGGAGAVLANPLQCGAATTAVTFTPWSFPATPAATASAAYTVDADGHGGACPSAWPTDPTFVAGPSNPKAGAFTALTLTATRGDRQAPLSSLSLTTPPGFTALVGTVPLCTESDAEAGTCPSSSRIGTATVGAGVGVDSGLGAPSSHQLFLSGTVYLTGPTDGDPFGVEIVVNPVVGPFNLSTPFGTPVIVRAGTAIDPKTAQITIGAQFPTILDGVLLHVQTVSITLDRPNFALNATSCTPETLSGEINGSPVSTPYQVGGCSALGFNPRIAVTASGRPTHLNGASLDLKVTIPSGGANLQSVSFTLPTTLTARFTTVQQACIDTTFNVNPSSCPAGSMIGTATAFTPLLPGALHGTVYVVSHGNASFPTLNVVLDADGVTIGVAGQVKFTASGQTSATVPSIPDVPIESLELELPEGPHSVLTSPTTNLCGDHLTIPTTLVAHNGLTIAKRLPVALTGCPAAIALNAYAAALHGYAVFARLALPSAGRVTLTGRYLHNLSRMLAAGEHRLRVALNTQGRRALKHGATVTVKIAYAGRTVSLRLRRQ